MDKLKAYLKLGLQILLVIMFIIGTITPLVYWGFHAELTYMQIFLKLWWTTPLTLASAGGLMFIKKK